MPGRGGAPKFFLDWLTFALQLQVADHIRGFPTPWEPLPGGAVAVHSPSPTFLSRQHRFIEEICFKIRNEINRSQAKKEYKRDKKNKIRYENFLKESGLISKPILTTRKKFCAGSFVQLYIYIHPEFFCSVSFFFAKQATSINLN